ncbi:hypothetical protein LCGC14_2787090 [marine sediment metagenome]|uniref:Uncharacterized protein n=1 Tax=marine sediment metagenome TaxID=412755 RepID=A0A0F8YRN4_9ZZZZ
MKILKPKQVRFHETFSIPIKHKANGFQCVNVIIGGVSRRDIKSVFGPLTGKEEIVRINIDAQWGHLLKELGIFPSISQARKNGWDKPIELGFSEVMFKKKRKVIFVLKLHPTFFQRLIIARRC